MHKLAHLVHKNSKRKESHSVPSSALQPVKCSEQDLYRYRKQRGVNLGISSTYFNQPIGADFVVGSWFVLEPWISPAPFRFAKAPAQCDLDVAHGSHAKEVLETHWDTWIVEEDWKWIKDRGINTVRIPVRAITFHT